jgi:hypothetical protein
MSVTLDLVVRLREPRPPAELETALMDAVEKSPGWAGPLRIRAGDTGEGLGAERTRGDCALVLGSAWPFYDDGTGLDADARASVADSTTQVIGLVERVVAAVNPTSLRLHTDDGPPLPFNAHLAYYADHEAVLDDLQWIAELWQRGDQRWRLEPLRDVPPDRKHWATHEWRTASATTDLLRRLGPLVVAVPAIGGRQVDDVLQAGSCRHRRLGTTGFLVLNDGPGVAPGFIDRFYTESADVL